MGSSIRNLRDQRFSTRTKGERRDNTNGGSNQKGYNAEYTSHTSSVAPPAFTGEPSNTDHKVDHVHELIRDQLAPRIQTKSANALLSDRREFYYYKKKKTGRRCSCFLEETSPENQCPVCLGKGIVGGYEKHGTITEILDFTTPDLVMVNCEPNFNEDTRPVHLRLQNGAKFGHIEASFQIKNNTGKLDTYNLFQPIYNRGTKIFAIDPNGFSSEIKECEDFEPFLAFNKIRVRIEFEAGDKRPVFSHFLFRYKVTDNQLVFGDIARSQEAPTQTQFGFFDSYQEIPIFFSGKEKFKIEAEDVLYRIHDGRKFKIVMVNENWVAGVLTSVDSSARYLIPNVDIGEQNLLT